MIFDRLRQPLHVKSCRMVAQKSRASRGAVESQSRRSCNHCVEKTYCDLTWPDLD